MEELHLWTYENNRILFNTTIKFLLFQPYIFLTIWAAFPYAAVLEKYIETEHK
jgi:hypothetical protein